MALGAKLHYQNSRRGIWPPSGPGDSPGALAGLRFGPFPGAVGSVLGGVCGVCPALWGVPALGCVGDVVAAGQSPQPIPAVPRARLQPVLGATELLIPCGKGILPG